ncbi:DUF883 family protein [Bordetella genomosp. 13]|uniref:DUF883 family protein n=1 Tax=Bordetella genomosp. 13 TaxID=463040 RepID=UPI0011AA7136|nr:DUF883 family protein [Bordetella genomosp. 13]
MAIEKASDKAKELVDDGADAAESAIDQVAHSARRGTRAAQDLLDNTLDEGGDAVENAVLCAKDFIRQNPFTAVAAVAAVAYLWGRIRG